MTLRTWSVRGLTVGNIFVAYVLVEMPLSSSEDFYGCLTLILEPVTSLSVSCGPDSE